MTRIATRQPVKRLASPYGSSARRALDLASNLLDAFDLCNQCSASRESVRVPSASATATQPSESTAHPSIRVGPSHINLHDVVAHRSWKSIAQNRTRSFNRLGLEGLDAGAGLLLVGGVIVLTAPSPKPSTALT